MIDYGIGQQTWKEANSLVHKWFPLAAVSSISTNELFLQKNTIRLVRADSCRVVRYCSANLSGERTSFLGSQSVKGLFFLWCKQRSSKCGNRKNVTNSTRVQILFGKVFHNSYFYFQPAQTRWNIRALSWRGVTNRWHAIEPIPETDVQWYILLVFSESISK